MTAALKAADVQMRVEALRAAAVFCSGHPDEYHARGVCTVAEIFEAWLLGTVPPEVIAVADDTPLFRVIFSKAAG